MSGQELSNVVLFIFAWCWYANERTKIAGTPLHPKLKDGINSMIIRSAFHWHYLYSRTVLSGFENINWLCFSCNCHPFTECQPTCKIGLGDGATCKRFLSVQDHLPIQNLKQVQR